MRGSLRLTALVLSLAMALAAAAAEPSEIRVAEQYGLAFLPLMIMRDQHLVERRAKQLGLAKLEVKWARLGAVSAIVGALLYFGTRLPFRLGRLPGDIVHRGEHTTFYFPIVTCLVISVVLSILFWFFSNFRR